MNQTASRHEECKKKVDVKLKPYLNQIEVKKDRDNMKKKFSHAKDYSARVTVQLCYTGYLDFDKLWDLATKFAKYWSGFPETERCHQAERFSDFLDELQLVMAILWLKSKEFCEGAQRVLRCPNSAQKESYLRYWLQSQGLPL